MSHQYSYLVIDKRLLIRNTIYLIPLLCLILRGLPQNVKIVFLLDTTRACSEVVDQINMIKKLDFEVEHIEESALLCCFD